MHYYVIPKISLIITFHYETASCSESPDPSSFLLPLVTRYLLREGSSHARLALFGVEGEDGGYRIFSESSVTTPVVVKVCWPEVKRADLRPSTRLKVFTNTTPNSMNPLPSFCMVGRAIHTKRVESNFGFFSIDGHRAISLFAAPRNTTAVRHTIDSH